MGNKKVPLWQIFLQFALDACDMDPNVHSLLAGYLLNVTVPDFRILGAIMWECIIKSVH